MSNCLSMSIIAPPAARMTGALGFPDSSLEVEVTP
jgi:hypothetical protein